jgi:hypothetical protein
VPHPLLIAAALALPLLGGTVAHAGRSRVAQAAVVSPVATDRAASGVARLVVQRNQRASEKRSLQATYQAQLRDLDRLKRSKASWRRDGQIRAKKAESQVTAARLQRVDAELRAFDSQLVAQRKALVDSINRELAQAPAASRRALLEKLRTQVTAVLRPRARKIILPDDSLDELADTDELLEQIALIRQAESELNRERQALRQREDRYARMDRLRVQRERAGQLSELDDDQVRRSTGRTESGRNQGGGDLAEDDDSGSPAGGLGDSEAPPSEPDTSFETSSVVLADVIDSTTIDALRRAGRSPNPKSRAEAAARARKQVESLLERLEKSRLLIQRHLRKLRAQ